MGSFNSSLNRLQLRFPSTHNQHQFDEKDKQLFSLQFQLDPFSLRRSKALSSRYLLQRLRDGKLIAIDLKRRLNNEPRINFVSSNNKFEYIFRGLPQERKNNQIPKFYHICSTLHPRQSNLFSYEERCGCKADYQWSLAVIPSIPKHCLTLTYTTCIRCRHQCECAGPSQDNVAVIKFYGFQCRSHRNPRPKARKTLSEKKKDDVNDFNFLQQRRRSREHFN